MKKALTDRAIAALKPAARGKRYLVTDSIMPGLAVRVTDKGHRTFVLGARYPGSPHFVRRELGEVGALTLAEARDKARDWVKLIKTGTDPRVAAARTQASTFAAAAEEYIAKRIIAGKQRRAKESIREIRVDLIQAWGDRPVTSITKADVITLVDRIAARPALYPAHAAFGHLRTFFNWMINRGTFGLDTSPCDRLKINSLVGNKKARTRVLTDNELRELWLATETISYPAGPLVQMLMLTGCRLREVSDARWSEFDDKLWTIPAARFKSDAQHIIPLTPDMRTLLASLPRWQSGDCLFSAHKGKQPMKDFSYARKLLEAAVHAEERWVFHDIRRTVRTRLSQLRIPEPVAEMVIGHGKKGLARVYDQHKYLEEMGEALQAWNNLLRTIVAGKPAPNVYQLRA